jgi:hypothetical protein
MKQADDILNSLGGETGFAVLNDGQGGHIIRMHDGTSFVELHERDMPNGDIIAAALMGVHNWALLEIAAAAWRAKAQADA